MKHKALLLVLLLALCALPALAQDTNMITFNGFGFSFPSSVATNVNLWQYPGDPTDTVQPGGPVPPHDEFALYSGTTVPQSELGGAGGVGVYNVADLAGYPEANTQYQALQTLLAQRPDLTTYTNPSGSTNGPALPYLPVPNAAQVVRSQAKYVDTPSVSGVSYLTSYRQDVGPFLSNSFLYTFQGLSTDGSRYVAATFPVTTTLFPAEMPADFDDATFSQNYQQYLIDSGTTLNNAQPTDFTPLLTDLDGIIQSFTFTGAAPVPGATATPIAPVLPTMTATDASMGGLAGVTWTLVSYGDPAAPTAALPGAPVTATFSGEGISGSAGCNTYSGAFQFSGGSLTIGPLITTRMACADDVNAQESAYLTALSTATGYTINGTQLQINYDGGVLVFTSAPATPVINATAVSGLEGTTWTLVSYGDPAAQTPAVPGTTVTATFADGGVSGSAGCNSYSGSYTTNGATLTVAPTMATTMMACGDAAVNLQERAYLAALTSATGFRIDGTQLQISYNGGVLVYNAS